MQFELHSARSNSKSKIEAFGGLCRRDCFSVGEGEDMLNMSSRAYPFLAPAFGREKTAEALGEIKAVASPDSEVLGVTGVYSGGFYYNGVLKSEGFELPKDYLWQIERMGSLYLINGFGGSVSVLFSYNCDTDEFADGGVVLRDLCVTTSEKAISTYPYAWDKVVDYQTETADGKIIKNKTFWDKYGKELSGTDNFFSKYFKIGDEVTIFGFPETTAELSGRLWTYDWGDEILKPVTNYAAPDNNTVDTDNLYDIKTLSKWKITKAVVTSFSEKEHIYNHDSTKYKGLSHIMGLGLYNKNGDIVPFTDLKNKGEYGTYCSGVVIMKRSRVFDNIAVHHGRIWGSSPNGNMLYASAADNIFSFSAEDISKKFAARLVSDTPGRFTAISNFGGELVAFKEDSISVVSGINPNNYYISTIEGIGAVSKASVVKTPNGIIFLSRRGFYIYSGGVPELISEKPGGGYKDAVAGFDGVRYYASALRSDGTRELLVFDTRRGLWHKEDDFAAVGFFRGKGEFYAADKGAVYKIGSAVPKEWYFTLKPARDGGYDNVALSEIYVFAKVNSGARIWLETAVDGGGFVRHNTLAKAERGVFRCPVRIRSGSVITVRICGVGDAVVYGIEKKFRSGGRMIKGD